MPLNDFLIFIRLLNPDGGINLTFFILIIGIPSCIVALFTLVPKLLEKLKQLSLYKKIKGIPCIQYKILLVITIICIILVLLGIFPCPSCLKPDSSTGLIIINHTSPIYIYPEYYDPSGKMGDTGDIIIEKGTDKVRFIYEVKGRTPHEWDWKYIDNCTLNQEPAEFGGVLYLNPPNNWGNYPGWDLRPFRKIIKWEARSVNNESYVEFFIGGIIWKWEGCNKVPVRYPDSMPRKSLGGIKKLTENWQEFQYDLSNCEENYFKNVVGGFGWVMNWGSNRVYLNDTRTGPKEPKTFIIEVRNIRFEGF